MYGFHGIGCHVCSRRSTVSGLRQKDDGSCGQLHGATCLAETSLLTEALVEVAGSPAVELQGKEQHHRRKRCHCGIVAGASY